MDANCQQKRLWIIPLCVVMAMAMLAGYSSGGAVVSPGSDEIDTTSSPFEM